MPLHALQAAARSLALHARARDLSTFLAVAFGVPVGVTSLQRLPEAVRHQVWALAALFDLERNINAAANSAAASAGAPMAPLAPALLLAPVPLATSAAEPGQPKSVKRPRKKRVSLDGPTAQPIDLASPVLAALADRLVGEAAPPPLEPFKPIAVPSAAGFKSRAASLARDAHVKLEHSADQSVFTRPLPMSRLTPMRVHAVTPLRTDAAAALPVAPAGVIPSSTAASSAASSTAALSALSRPQTPSALALAAQAQRVAEMAQAVAQLQRQNQQQQLQLKARAQAVSQAQSQAHSRAQSRMGTPLRHHSPASVSASVPPSAAASAAAVASAAANAAAHVAAPTPTQSSSEAPPQRQPQPQRSTTQLVMTALPRSQSLTTTPARSQPRPQSQCHELSQSHARDSGFQCSQPRQEQHGRDFTQSQEVFVSSLQASINTLPVPVTQVDPQSPSQSKLHTFSQVLSRASSAALTAAGVAESGNAVAAMAGSVRPDVAALARAAAVSPGHLMSRTAPVLGAAAAPSQISQQQQQQQQ